MLDIKLFRETPELIDKAMKDRGMDYREVEKVVKLDKEWRALKEEVDQLRAKRNSISKEISEAKKAGKNADKIMKEAKEIPTMLVDKENQMEEKKEARDNILKEIPNIPDKSVPVGDASANKVLKEYGKIPKFDFTPKDHADILDNLGLLDTEKASEVAGARFYYLKGDLVKLNLAIINYALDFLRGKGFVLMHPPFMLRREVLSGAIPLAAFEEMIYKIEGEDLYLIGTAEHALNAYHMNEVVNVKEPIRYAGLSPCFRKEAGSHGKDTKGIFRIHQFEKIEQFIFCKPEDSWKEFDLILNNTVELFKGLGIPFRTICLATGDMGRVPAKTVDIEGWFPSMNTYRELGSCSNCTDYQARRSNIKFQQGEEFKFVHTLNNTAIATERMIVCLIDNYQQKDGTVKVPDALLPYMNGVKFLTGIKKVVEKREKKAEAKAEKKEDKKVEVKEVKKAKKK